MRRIRTKCNATVVLVRCSSEQHRQDRTIIKCAPPLTCGKCVFHLARQRARFVHSKRAQVRRFQYAHRRRRGLTGTCQVALGRRKLFKLSKIRGGQVKLSVGFAQNVTVHKINSPSTCRERRACAAETGRVAPFASTARSSASSFAATRRA